MNENKKEHSDRFAFLAPLSVIKKEHLTRSDTRKIKAQLALKMGSIAFLVACALFVINIILIVYQGVVSNWKTVEVYGLSATISRGICIIGSAVTIISLLVARNAKTKKLSRFLPRFALDVLYISVLIDLIGCFYADAEKGFLRAEEVLSPSVLFVFILLFLQPAYWVDMWICDALTCVSILVVAAVTKYQFNMSSVFYNVILAILFLPAAHIVSSTLFYAETQSYCQKLINERLNNKVLYDELTHCKSRVALKEFLKDNEERWESHKTEILLIMFDIDNFKQYNDQFSHISGDHCLKRVSDAIRGAFPTPNLNFFRYGGEEFLLFFEIRENESAASIMERARNAVKEIKLVAPEGAPKDIVTISLGGSTVITDYDYSFENQLKLVDSYLYQAKSSGKDVSVLNGSIIRS